MPKPEITKQIFNSARVLVLILALCYGLSLFARLNWFFDLFSHFAIQYAFAGLFLGATLAYFKAPRFALLALFVGLASLFEIYRHVEIIAPAQNIQPDLTVVQYNRRYDLPDHQKFIKWVHSNHALFDVIVLQETTVPHKEAAESLRELYPHQIHEARQNAFGMVVLSKFPFDVRGFVDLKKYGIRNFALHFIIRPDGRTPVSIYAVHPPPPTMKKLYDQRHSDLFTVAGLIIDDPHTNIIMAGDWNLSPYSPVFSDLLETTGLRYQITTPYPVPTWPWHFRLPLLQIPIDHILSKGNLQLLSKTRGPAMHSDHYPVIASFAINPHD